MTKYDFKIFVDTREQTAWGFEFYDCTTEEITIKYGDYTVQGMEDRIRIERKASTAEIFGNLCTKNGLRKFKREMAELQATVDSFFILCEFPETYMYTFPVNSGIPKSEWPKPSAKFLRKRMYELQEEFDVKVIYCEDAIKAEEIAYNILRETYERYK